MSPPQIEKHSIRIRAWLIKMIVKGLPKGTTWIQSLKIHISGTMEVNKWFQIDNFAEIQNPLTRTAISTLLPDQCLSGDAIRLATESLNLALEPDVYLADVLVSQLPSDRILRILRKRTRQLHQHPLNKILVPINVKSTHWYLGVLQRQESGDFRLMTQNNCMNIRNEKAEHNLRAIGKNLSRLAYTTSEIDTPTKFQHRRYPKSSETQGISDSTIQKGRSRQSINKSSRCLLMELTNTPDQEEAGSQLDSQSSEQVNYGTQPDGRIESYEDYDWEQDQMIRYSRKEDETNCL